MVQWFHHQIGWLLRSCPTSKQPTLPWAVSVGISNYPSMHSKAVEVKKNQRNSEAIFCNGQHWKSALKGWDILTTSWDIETHWNSASCHLDSIDLAEPHVFFKGCGLMAQVLPCLDLHSCVSCRISSERANVSNLSHPVLSGSILHHLAPSCTSFHPLSASDCTALLSALCISLQCIGSDPFDTFRLHFVSVYCVTLLCGCLHLHVAFIRIPLHLVVLHGFMQHCTEHNRFATSHLKMLHCILLIPLDRKALHWPFVGLCWNLLDYIAMLHNATHCIALPVAGHTVRPSWPGLRCFVTPNYLSCAKHVHRITQSNIDCIDLQWLTYDDLQICIICVDVRS